MKKDIASQLKPILKQYNIKSRLRVIDCRIIVLTLVNGKIDLDKDFKLKGKSPKFSMMGASLGVDWTGEALKFFVELRKAMQSAGWSHSCTVYDCNCTAYDFYHWAIDIDNYDYIAD